MAYPHSFTVFVLSLLLLSLSSIIIIIGAGEDIEAVKLRSRLVYRASKVRLERQQLLKLLRPQGRAGASSGLACWNLEYFGWVPC